MPNERWTGDRVRENRPPYGAARPDRYPADDVLEDLGSPDEVDGARSARILARYAALRAWMLRGTGDDPALARHADEAARAHLAAVGAWPEGDLLLRLLDATLDSAPWLLARAAAEAESAGDSSGAAALRRAAGEAALLRLLEARRRRN